MTATCHNTAVAVGYQGHSGRCQGGHMTATCHNTAVAVGYQGHSGRC